MSGRRKTPRAPILSQVEAESQNFAALGQASNISLGGLLFYTRETLAEGVSVVVRFFVPPERAPIEAAGQVIRSEAGKAMAIGFLGLPETDRQRIVAYIERIQGTPAETLLLEPRDPQPRRRRSGRLAHRVPVTLSWQDDAGHPQQEAAETQFLSRYGAQVLGFSELKLGKLVRVAVPGRGKEGLARVVSTAPARVPGRVETGLEFVEEENLWGIEFPPDQAPAPQGAKLARRRSARLPRQIAVTLSWEDELGRAREEFGQTILISKHGAAVSSLVALPDKQPFRLRAPEMNREADSHVVWVKASPVPGRTDLGVEFIEVEDFWGIPFPPDPGTPRKKE